MSDKPRPIRGTNPAKDAKLKAREMRPEDVEPCPGPEPKIPCGKPADPAISGYDNVFRCIACHRIHVELVLKEAGESEPNASEDRAADMLKVRKGETGEQARRRAILQQYGSPQAPTTEAERSGIVDARGRPMRVEASRPNDAKQMTAEERRAAILRKYGAPGRQS